MSTTNFNNPMSESAIHARLREKLNVECIKLWTEPFFNSVTEIVVDSEIIALASRYATELNFEVSKTIACLFALQRNALERIAEREFCKSTGMSTLRLKFSGFTTNLSFESNVDRIHMNLSTSNGKDLRRRVAEIISIKENRLKLISVGRILKDDLMLEMQCIKNGSQIMVLCVFGGERDEEEFRQLEETRGAADYLAGEQYDGDYSLNVENQDGKILDLPPDEKKALGVALVFHEKGRAAMKSEDFSRALLLLIEADTVYNECRSDILNSVDNYGLLNLDIAWCYLMLQSISELPAVEVRLEKCEKALNGSYGEHMERLVALKGSTGWEAALFVRLHLLQGIASYHLGHIERATFYIRKVESEIERLRISDNQLAELIHIGYSTDEATMALRATYGNMEGAVNYILRIREEKDALLRKEREKHLRHKLQKRLGMTAQGHEVNILLLENLVEMGYNAILANSALKRANNDINSALQLVTDTAFISSVFVELQNSSSTETLSETQSSVSAPELSPQVPSTSTANRRERQFSPISPSLETLLTQTFGVNLDDMQDTRSSEDIEKAKHAFENISKDISSESDYVDLTLSRENEFFLQYKNLLNI